MSEVLVGMASIPSRESRLRMALQSLLPQVDRICVYLNEYDYCPSFLVNPKIDLAWSQDHGLFGDAGKFFFASEAKGYYLTCDDDLRYLPGYVERLISGIERYRREAVVSLHGSIFPLNAQSPYDRGLFSCLVRVRGDYVCHTLGTGVMGYHVSTWEVPFSIFQAPNMADVWLADYAQRLQVPFICIEHAENWVEDLDPEETIFDASAHRQGGQMDTLAQQCAVVSARKWELNYPRLPSTVEPC